MSAPEQHAPPVYACAAGAVLHAHAGAGLEPAVVLHTFLPPGADEQLSAPSVRVDVHGDGPVAATGTVTVRALAGDRSFSWQLPVAPFVAALPGQPGNDGRMVLLAVVDAEPEPGFWAEPVSCERVAAELQLPVTDLAEALRGRLTPWLAEDLDVLLHDDAHERAVARSPAQTLASAVLAHYRGDLTAEKATVALVRAVELGPDDYTLELGTRLCDALVTAVDGAQGGAVAAVLEHTGPFEEEVVRLLTGLPAALAAAPADERMDAATAFLLVGPERDETLGAAVSVVARLARATLGPDRADADVLRHLAMVDDAGLVRLAELWVALASGAAGPSAHDGIVAAALAGRVRSEGPVGEQWLRRTAGSLVSLGARVRGGGRVAGPLPALLASRALDAAAVVQAGLPVARHLRQHGRLGPGQWLEVPAPVAARAVARAYLDGLDRESAADLLCELVADDVDEVDLLEALVCATAQLLSGLDPGEDPSLRQAQAGELLAAVPGGPRGARWVLAALLRGAPAHDPAAADLSGWLPAGPPVDVRRAAGRAGRLGLLSTGLVCLDALAAVLGEPAQVPREELLCALLPSALEEHGLLDPVGPPSQEPA